MDLQSQQPHLLCWVRIHVLLGLKVQEALWTCHPLQAPILVILSQWEQQFGRGEEDSKPSVSSISSHFPHSSSPCVEEFPANATAGRGILCKRHEENMVQHNVVSWAGSNSQSQTLGHAEHV